MNRFRCVLILILLASPCCFGQIGEVRQIESLLLDSRADSAYLVAQRWFSDIDDPHLWGTLADLFFKYKQYHAASFWLEKLYHQTPRKTLKQALYTSYYNQGVQSIAESKWLFAIDFFERALHLDSLHIELYHAKAKAWSHLNHIPKAIESLDKGLICFPQNDSLHLHKIALLTKAERWRDLKQALINYNSFSDRLEYRLLFVDVLIKLNEPQKALVELERLYKDHPVEKVRAPLISFYQSLGNPEAALDLYKDWKKICPACKNAWLGMIQAFFQMGQQDTCLALCKEALQRWPDDPPFLERAIQSAAAAGENKVSLDWAQRWVAVDSVNDRAWLTLANLLKEADPHRALKYYRRARNHPVAVYQRLSLEDNLEFSQRQSLQQHAFRRLVQAIAHREQGLAQRAAVEDFSLHADRGSLREMVFSLVKEWQGNRTLLIDEIESGLQKYPNSPLLLKLLITEYQKTENIKAGLATFRHYFSVRPDDVIMQIMYADLLVKMDEFERAYTIYRACAEHDRENAGLQLKCIAMADQLDDLPDLAFRWQKIVTILPDSETKTLRRSLINIWNRLGRNDKVMALLNNQ